jgi:hypothetical protein
MCPGRNGRGCDMFYVVLVVKRMMVERSEEKRPNEREGVRRMYVS